MSMDQSLADILVERIKGPFLYGREARSVEMTQMSEMGEMG